MVEIELPIHFNSKTAPTIREFYLFLMSGLQAMGINYDVIPPQCSPYKGQPLFMGGLRSRLAECAIKKYRNRLCQSGTEPDYRITYNTCGRIPGRIHVKMAYFPNTFYFDTRGFHAWADIAVNIQDYPIQTLDASYAERRFREISSSVINQERRIRDAEEDAGPFLENMRPYVLLALQPEHGLFAQHARVGVYDLLCECLTRIPPQGLNLVIKPHPQCGSRRIKSVLDDAKGIKGVHITRARLHDAVRRAFGVIVVNSEAGFHSLLHLKPVLTFGDCDYKWATYVNTSKHSLDAAREKMDSFYEIQGENEDTIRKFVVYFLDIYCITLGDNYTLFNMINKSFV